MKLGIRTKRLTHAYARELKKHFGNSRFQAVLHFNGYENYIISMFEQAPFSRTIWMHNDMEKEIERKKNPNKYVLHDAYASYDHVAAVSRDLQRLWKPSAGEGITLPSFPTARITKESKGDPEKPSALIGKPNVPFPLRGFRRC